MEWTGRQQILFLLQSIGLGFIVGFCLDSVTAVTQRSARRRWRLSDMLFGPIAALLVFLGALVIMDGQLHPLLILGSFWGMLAEHFTLGIWVGKLLQKVRYYIRKLNAILIACAAWGIRNILDLMRYVGRFSKRMRKKVKKH